MNVFNRLKWITPKQEFARLVCTFFISDVSNTSPNHQEKSNPKTRACQASFLELFLSDVYFPCTFPFFNSSLCSFQQPKINLYRLPANKFAVLLGADRFQLFEMRNLGKLFFVTEKFARFSAPRNVPYHAVILNSVVILNSRSYRSSFQTVFNYPPNHQEMKFT